MFTVIIGFSVLIILAYVLLLPMTNEQSILKRTDSGLKSQIEKFKDLKENTNSLNRLDLDT